MALDVSDAALTPVGVGAPTRLIVRAGGATLGRPRLSHPVPCGIGAAETRHLLSTSTGGGAPGRAGWSATEGIHVAEVADGP
ncbi:MAG: hypothetical protein ACREXX_10210 [Gammaproteobacteria bacterium]